MCKMSGIRRMEKLKQIEAERFQKLELNKKQGDAVLLDEPTLWGNIRVVSGYLNKLYPAVTYYKEAVTDLISSEEMNINLGTVYTRKLNEQLKLTDPILAELQNVVNCLNTASKATRVFACIKTKIQSMQIMVKDKIAVIQDVEEDMLSSLPRIKDYLSFLEEVVSNTSKELDSILKQISEEELTDITRALFFWREPQGHS